MAVLDPARLSLLHIAAPSPPPKLPSVDLELTPSFMLQSDAPQLGPRWTILALVLLGLWGLGVSLNSAIQAGGSFFHCRMPYPELENEKLCRLARGTLVTAWISTVSVSR